jgi:glucose-1-phosphate cytidylyltransferase
MKVVILCGGLGTRLREETEFRPKPLVDVGGRPILWHIMKIYGAAGLRQFVLCLGYKGEMIKEYFLNYEAMNNDFTVALGTKHQIRYHGGHQEQDFEVTLADTGAETQTGGRLHRAERYVEGDTFLMTYGDGLADVDVTKLLAFHRAHGKLATVTTVRPFSRFGMVDLADGDRVRRFGEKPQIAEWANAGYFVFDRRVFDYLGDDDCVLEKEPLEKLALDGELHAFRHDGFFYAMDTYREYKHLNELWASGQAPWKVWR